MRKPPATNSIARRWRSNGSVLNARPCYLRKRLLWQLLFELGSGLYRNGAVGLYNSALDFQPLPSGPTTDSRAWRHRAAAEAFRIEHTRANFFMAYGGRDMLTMPGAGCCERGGDFSEARSRSSRSKSSICFLTGLPFSGSKIPPTQIAALGRKPCSIIIRCPASVVRAPIGLPGPINTGHPSTGFDQ